MKTKDDKFLDDYFNTKLKPTIVSDELKAVSVGGPPPIEETQAILNKHVSTGSSFEEITGKIKDYAQTAATGLALAPAELAQGAIRLVSPETADKMKAGINNIRDFQKTNTVGSNFNLSPETESQAYGIGQALAAAPITGASVGANAIGGLALGVAQSKEGDTAGDVATKGALGAITGGAVTAGLKGAGKVASLADEGVSALPLIGNVYSAAKGKAAELLGAGKTSLDDASSFNAAARKELNSTYKELGIATKGMMAEQRVAHEKFISSFADEYNTQVSKQYTEALAQKAPDSLAAFLQKAAPPKTDAAVRKVLMESADPWDVAAVSNPESMLYYQQYQAALKNLPNAGPGATGLAKDIVSEMKAVSKDYVTATDMYNTKQLLAKNINSNFFNAVQNDKTVVPAAVDLINKGGNGSDAIRQLFNNGFREQLVKNSNQPPIVQLANSLGSDPLKQQNTLAFLRSTGMDDVADKYTGLLGLVNTAKSAALEKTGNAKYLGTALEDMDNDVLHKGISAVLNSSSKWSKEFNNVLQRKADALTRAELLVNVIKRAGKTASSITSAKAAINISNSSEGEGSDY